MPLIKFKSEEHHKHALKVLGDIAVENDAAPLEARVTGFITKFEDKNEEPYAALYAFSHQYLARLSEAGVEFFTVNWSSETLPRIMELLSADGKTHLARVYKDRPEHLYL